MKRLTTYIVSLATAFSLTACHDFVDGINESPDNVKTDQIDAGLYLNTPELAIASIDLELLNLHASMWSGQLIGINSRPLTWYQYIASEDTYDFDGYQSVIEQCKYIQQAAPDNNFYQGVTRILEAMLFGTYADVFGDIPCKEVATGVENPHFESQKEVFAYVQQLLTDGIDYLQRDGGSYRQDFFFDGDKTKWTETAYTLKARYYTITKDYSQAFENALKGISDDANSMYFKPVDDDLTTNKNKLYTEIVSLADYTTTDDNGKNSFLLDVLDGHNNSKTDETARKAYYEVDANAPANNHGIAARLEPQALVTYKENLLILAETAARTQGFAKGLEYLNKLRSWLNDGGCANDYYITLSHKYEAYTESDFATGGILNADGLAADRALLREIIKERYISGFLTFTPFDDARRLRGANESDIALDIPLNTATATQHPERFYYPHAEMIANQNAPEEPGMYAPTEVNR